jgi:hypothetical protein
MIEGNRSGKHCAWIALCTWISLSALLPACVVVGLATGCGAPAAPQPPTLNLPQPVRDLAATRAGDSVHLTFSVPQKTTDKLPVRGAMTARLCRAVESGPCQSAVTLTIPAQQKSFSMDDTLPVELTQGSPRLLTYKLAVLNRAGKSGGDSAPVYTVAGMAPATVAGFTAMPQRKGIVLTWQGTDVPTGILGWVRFDRVRTSAPPPPAQPLSGSQTAETTPGHHRFAAGKAEEEPAEQVLRAPQTGAEHPGSAIDATAHTGNSYRYIAQRIYQVALGSRTIEIAGQPSAPVETEYRDVFPPPVPVGLVSAADSASKAIDLDWTPDVDPALAGYIVYRRAIGTRGAPERVSPAGKPVTTSSWSDASAAPGQRYAYSVSAIDLSGNESQRSAEVEDQWSGPGAEPNSQSTPQPDQHP